MERDELTEWALRARDGDAIAQATFVRMSQTDVWRLCAALCSPSEADDLVQETYVRSFRALPGFLARSSARTWLLSIARRSCADHIRGRQRRRRLDTILRRTTPEVEQDPAAQYAAQELLTQLSDERRSAFVLTQVLGLSYLETANVEDVPIGTIRSRVARAREDLIATLRHAETV
ncbi:MAG: sigma-70 family RNA polymerase sigma factor [Mycobacteriales bacterium]